MLQKSILLMATAMLSVSCVSKKVFTDLEDKYNKLKYETNELLEQNDQLQATQNSDKDLIKQLENSQEELTTQKNTLAREKEALQNSYDELKKTYDLLASRSSTALEKNARENRALLTELEAKETALIEEGVRLKKIQKELDARSKRVNDLEAMIAQKEAAMNQLKNAVSHALKGFEGQGLTVVQKNGKVYVSMENKLLFNSGSWTIGEKGKRAVKDLAKVLAKNEQVKVLIEGHTDNDPYNGQVVKDNWDLSVKRATAIVRILQASNVKPAQITAAGRGEYLPVTSNATKAGKAKNRRIEIILSPNLDEIAKLLAE